MAFAPGGDISKAIISEAVMDAALKDVIFTVVDIPRERDSGLEVRIQHAVDQFRSFVEGSNLEYECWIEVDGLDVDSLPARFGGTDFVIWGDAEFDALKADMEDMPSVDEGMRPVHLDHIDEELWGKPVAIQRVWARDSQAAYSLAEREVQATLECLNFFAEVVPYNRTHLRVAHGMYSKRYALQVSRAHGSGFRYTERAVNPWRFSVNRLRELQGIAREALERTEALLCKADRSEMEELLLRSVRWVGRASAANRPEDKFLFSAIALECIALPVERPSITNRLSSRVSQALSRGDAENEWLQGEIRRLYKLRSRLVHDGSLETKEDDTAKIYAYALAMAIWAVTSPGVAKAISLKDLEAHFQMLATSKSETL